MNISEKLKSYLEKKHMTKAQASRAMGMDYRQVWRWCNMDSDNISARSAKRLAGFMKISLAELYK